MSKEKTYHFTGPPLKFSDSIFYKRRKWTARIFIIKSPIWGSQAIAVVGDFGFVSTTASIFDMHGLFNVAVLTTIPTAHS